MCPQIIISLLLSITFVCQLTQASGVFELELVKLDLHSSSSPRPANIISDNQQQQHQITLKTSDTNTKNLTTVIDLATNSRPAQKQPIDTAENSLSTNSGLVNVLVCLKEPYTSQVGPPCTFGNASILIRPDQDLKQNSALAPTTISPMNTIDQQTTSPDYPDQNQITTRSNATGANSFRVLKRTPMQQNNQNPRVAVAIKGEGGKQSNLVRINFTFRWMVSVEAM